MIKYIQNKKAMKMLLLFVFIGFLLFISTTRTYAAGDVAGVIEETWSNAEGQIKQVVNNVVFPALDIILAIFFFIKLGTAYFDYKKNNERFEWTAPAILFVCLIFTLTAPMYIWKIL